MSTEPTAPTMRAGALVTPGSIAGVEIVDRPTPRPGRGEVSVAVRSAALNHLDLWTIRGALGIELALPHVLGADGAGDIAEVGEGGDHLVPGTPVLIDPALACGRCERCNAGETSECLEFRILGEHVDGTMATTVVVPAANVHPFPGHLSFDEAAALGVTAITAYRMLFTRGRLKPGEWVLVTGIGGGLALSLFQLARIVAGKVIVTSSSNDKLARAEELGADAVINYKAEDVGRAVRKLTGKRGVDLVVDSAGGASVDASLRSLRKGGRLVIAGATAGLRADLDVRRLFWNQLEVIGSTMGSRADVADMLRMVAGTGLRPMIDRVFDLDDLPAALTHLETQAQFGKVVVRISP